MNTSSAVTIPGFMLLTGKFNIFHACLPCLSNNSNIMPGTLPLYILFHHNLKRPTMLTNSSPDAHTVPASAMLFILLTIVSDVALNSSLVAALSCVAAERLDTRSDTTLKSFSSFLFATSRVCDFCIYASNYRYNILKLILRAANRFILLQ